MKRLLIAICAISTAIASTALLEEPASAGAYVRRNGVYVPPSSRAVTRSTRSAGGGYNYPRYSSPSYNYPQRSYRPAQLSPRPSTLRDLPYQKRSTYQSKY